MRAEDEFLTPKTPLGMTESDVEGELDKEVEDAEGEAEEKEEGAPGEAAAGKLDNGIEEAGGNDAKSRLPAAFIEGAGGNVAREIAAEDGELVVHPEGEFGAIAPEGERAEDKNAITEESKRTERWTITPRQHRTSQRAGHRFQASS